MLLQMMGYPVDCVKVIGGAAYAMVNANYHRITYRQEVRRAFKAQCPNVRLKLDGSVSHTVH